LAGSSADEKIDNCSTASRTESHSTSGSTITACPYPGMFPITCRLVA
jgi:hypothetical protein